MLHGSCVRLHGRGVLILGPSGSGKSALCIDLLGRGGWLVADDAVDLTRHGAKLLARCPEPIRGQIELRGLGLARVPVAACVQVHLVARLDEAFAKERLPAPASTGILGMELPLFYIAPHEHARMGSFVSAALARYIREVQ
ncbi:MAG TPA: HPr kinase/phosphatase C-terminal domain-containing protein [Geminicoccus sp.]|uniref:HPr kinase/phosphorylase n=1 Tax=Geminicoccus sp. TaxID=2024832 RepID=UPI002E3212D1|nr:HPr kinase/phosphatase C-terminal domain-containing protein [Geminicoccus sp.]HEX2525590.1 HPr kinase/phosphatase C-terminal domain-containing protein [Geminicoccus sp.]